MLALFVLDGVTSRLLGLHGWPAYLLVGALCFGEVALLIGFVLPGEIAAVYGGVLAARHEVDVVVVTAVVVGCAVFGNLVGYVVGRYLGPFLLTHRPLRGKKGVEKARLMLQRRGVLAVFFSRFVAGARALAPALAGMSDVAFPGFALASAASGILWGCGYCLGAYAAGESYAKLVSISGTASVSLVALVVVVVLAILVKRRRDGERDAKSTGLERGLKS